MATAEAEEARAEAAGAASALMELRSKLRARLAAVEAEARASEEAASDRIAALERYTRQSILHRKRRLCSCSHAAFVTVRLVCSLVQMPSGAVPGLYTHWKPFHWLVQSVYSMARSLCAGSTARP